MGPGPEGKNGAPHVGWMSIAAGAHRTEWRTGTGRRRASGPNETENEPDPVAMPGGTRILSGIALTAENTHATHAWRCGARRSRLTGASAPAAVRRRRRSFRSITLPAAETSI